MHYTPNYSHVHRGDFDVPTEVLPAISSVLAPSVPLRVSPCAQHKHNRVHHYVSESDHSWLKSEQMFQGEEGLYLYVLVES